MKKVFTLVIAAIALSGITGCSLLNEESVDTIVTWGFAPQTDTATVLGPEAYLPSAQTIFDAFDATFFKAGESTSRSHEIILRAQNGKKKALKNAKALAEEAAAKIPSGHTCPVDYIFVVNIQYGTESGVTTAWSHDYRK